MSPRAWGRFAIEIIVHLAVGGATVLAIYGILDFLSGPLMDLYELLGIAEPNNFTRLFIAVAAWGVLAPIWYAYHRFPRLHFGMANFHDTDDGKYLYVVVPLHTVDGATRAAAVTAIIRIEDDGTTTDECVLQSSERILKGRPYPVDRININIRPKKIVLCILNKSTDLLEVHHQRDGFGILGERLKFEITVDVDGEMKSKVVYIRHENRRLSIGDGWSYKTRDI